MGHLAVARPAGRKRFPVHPQVLPCDAEQRSRLLLNVHYRAQTPAVCVALTIGRSTCSPRSAYTSAPAELAGGPRSRPAVRSVRPADPPRCGRISAAADTRLESTSSIPWASEIIRPWSMIASLSHSASASSMHCVEHDRLALPVVIADDSTAVAASADPPALGWSRNRPRDRASWRAQSCAASFRPKGAPAGRIGQLELPAVHPRAAPLTRALPEIRRNVRISCAVSGTRFDVAAPRRSIASPSPARAIHRTLNERPPAGRSVRVVRMPIVSISAPLGPSKLNIARAISNDTPSSATILLRPRAGGTKTPPPRHRWGGRIPCAEPPRVSRLPFSETLAEPQYIGTPASQLPVQSRQPHRT